MGTQDEKRIRVGALNLNTGHYDEIATAYAGVSVSLAGLRLTVTESIRRPGLISVYLDPVNGEAVGIEVKSLNHDWGQLRFEARGLPYEERPQ